MNLYLIKRPAGDGLVRDAYDGAVVIANSEAEARLVHPCPDGLTLWDKERAAWCFLSASDRMEHSRDWIPPKCVEVTMIGTNVLRPTRASGSILGSYNAG